MSTKTKEVIELNRLKLNAMKLKVIQLEKLNVKTKAKSSEKMVEEIRKIIATEIKKNI